MDEMEVKIEGNFLIIKLPLEEGFPLSKSGNSKVIASTHGNQRTREKVEGKILTVGVNAYIPYVKQIS